MTYCWKVAQREDTEQTCLATGTVSNDDKLPNTNPRQRPDRSDKESQGGDCKSEAARSIKDTGSKGHVLDQNSILVPADDISLVCARHGGSCVVGAASEPARVVVLVEPIALKPPGSAPLSRLRRTQLEQESS